MTGAQKFVAALMFDDNRRCPKIVHLDIAELLHSNIDCMRRCLVLFEKVKEVWLRLDIPNVFFLGG